MIVINSHIHKKLRKKYLHRPVEKEPMKLFAFQQKLFGDHKAWALLPFSASISKIFILELELLCQKVQIVIV